MLNKPLSDDEIEILVGFSVGTDVQGLVKYVNRLLHKRSQGLDACARPLSFRQDDECKDTCFARGYLVKVKDFVEEQNLRARHGGSELDKVEIYIDGLVKEIDKFFV